MEFVLNVAQWRCGDSLYPASCFGEGSTCLLNEEGLSCCVGQFESQLGRTPAQLCSCLVASDLHYLRGELSAEPDAIFFCEEDGKLVDSSLADKLYVTNDIGETTPPQKIDAIKTFLTAAGHTLRVENEHLLARSEP